MKMLKQLYSFFASVQLAIFTLALLAASAIIGTIIPQGEPPAFYLQLFGEKPAQFIAVLDLDNMYSSWWFVGLLTLLTINLVVCSIKRFPLAWESIHRDNLAVSTKQLKKMPIVFNWQSTSSCTTMQLTEVLEKSGWTFKEKKEEGDNSLFFSQQGHWSRLGVYLVHLSIITIFIGALMGNWGGFRASVMVGEGEGVDTVYTLTGQRPIPLGFTVHCNSFFIDSYASGMPKEYRSNLSILAPDNTVKKRVDIKVNSPFSYQGITFYQSNYQGFRDFFVTVTDEKSGEQKIFQIPFQRSVIWQEKDLSIGILNVDSEGMRVVREKLWCKIGNTPAVTGWLDDNSSKTFTTGEKRFTVKIKQRYATGLQVSKDPGIWIVYLGCLMMLAGLYMAFFLSHKRVWLQLKKGQKNDILLAADANKNKRAMKKSVVELHIQLQRLFLPLDK